MIDKKTWIFVDDDPDAARSFADEFGAIGEVSVVVTTPLEARKLILNEMHEPAGVLMDVDLSNIPGETGTGPGIAQDIRTKQKGKEAKEFPIVRFSAAEPWARNILGDPSSDDLFELSIIKDDFKYSSIKVVNQIKSLQDLYSILNIFFEDSENSKSYLEKLFGLDVDRIGELVHDGLVAKILIGIKHAPHVAAAAYCKSFLIPTGLLIDEENLALRLGVDVIKSGEAWSELKQKLHELKYSGVCANGFQRWWARGLEDWWFSNIEPDEPLSSRTAEERVALLRKNTGIQALEPIRSVPEGTDTRYWRFCRLGLEKRPQEYIAVDPADAVRMTSQVDMPTWVEPYSASPRLAFRAKSDARLNYKDMDRLRKKYKVA